MRRHSSDPRLTPGREPPSRSAVINSGLAHLLQDFFADEAGGLLATLDVVELVIRSPARMLGIFAPAARFAADVVLPGNTARTHRSLVFELDFNVADVFFQFFDGLSSLHIPKAY